jgi:curved DNA-binding protein CbpA
VEQHRGGHHTTKSAMRTLYEILGVTSHATQAELKNAWRRAAMKWHPDRNRGREQYAQAEFQRINDAYAALTNPLRRAEYDLTLDGGPRRLAGRHMTRWQRFVHELRRAWLRLPGEDRRSLSHQVRRKRSLSRSQWLAGVGTAMLAAVLIADASVDDASVRSNFVSRQQARRVASAATPAGFHAKRRDVGQFAVQGAPDTDDISASSTFASSDNRDLDAADDPGLTSTPAPGTDPGLDEVHASLAEWRATENKTQDGAQPRADTGTQTAARPNSATADGAKAGVGIVVTQAKPAEAGGQGDVGAQAGPGVGSGAGLQALSRDDGHVTNEHAPAEAAHGASGVQTQPTGTDTSPSRDVASATPASASATTAEKPRDAHAPDKRVDSAHAATRHAVGAKAGVTPAHHAPPHLSQRLHADRAPPPAGMTPSHERISGSPLDMSEHTLTPYGFSPTAWRYIGGAGS